MIGRVAFVHRTGGAPELDDAMAAYRHSPACGEWFARFGLLTRRPRERPVR